MLGVVVVIVVPPQYRYFHRRSDGHHSHSRLFSRSSYLLPYHQRYSNNQSIGVLLAYSLIFIKGQTAYLQHNTALIGCFQKDYLHITTNTAAPGDTMRTDSAMSTVCNFDRTSRQSRSFAIVAGLGGGSSRNTIPPSSSHCFILVHLYHYL